MGRAGLHLKERALLRAQVAFGEDEQRASALQHVLHDAYRLQGLAAVQHDHYLKRIYHPRAERGYLLDLLLSEHVDSRL